MIRGRDFIVFGEDFGRHAHSLEHLMAPLWAENRVIWVETAGLRGPTLSVYDVRRVFEKLRSFARPAAAPARAANVSVIAPPMLPFAGFGWVRAINQASVLRAVRAEMQRRGFQHPFVVTSMPNSADFVRGYGEERVVYYCVDEFALWPGVPGELTRRLEKELLETADVVLATSEALRASRSRPGREARLLTHGVDFEHFAAVPPVTNGAPFTAGFFGLIDERIDQDLLVALCRRYPDLRFELRGPVRVDVSRLKALPNLALLPAVPYEELPRHLAGTSVFLLPYVLNEQTRHIQPLKLKEYAATGRPVVTTALAELESWRDCLGVADTPQAFVEMVGAVRAGTAHVAPDGARERARGESWTAKAEELCRLMFAGEHPPGAS